MVLHEDGLILGWSYMRMLHKKVILHKGGHIQDGHTGGCSYLRVVIYKSGFI